MCDMGSRFLVLAFALSLPLLAYAAPAPKASSFRDEFLHDLDDVQKKVLDLAAAVPAEKYAWRPGDGVRSVSEVYMHIAGANYVLCTFLGVQPPADMPNEIEKITDKKRILAELQKSFDHVRSIARGTADADLEQPVKMLGSETTKRGIFVTILNHVHEHLGQSVAYARVNGIVPPWSAAESVTTTPATPAPRSGRPSNKPLKRN